jgi:hypothetical protein
MRALLGGVIGAIVFASALWALAGVTTPANAGGPYQIYIYNSAEQPAVDLYAISVGERAAAAQVENCTGRLVDNPHEIVADLRTRSSNHDHISVVWVEGQGSSFNLGRCGEDADEGDKDEDEDSENAHEQVDSLVLVRDASAAQARQLIREIHGLPEQDRAAMIDALGLDRRAPARR